METQENKSEQPLPVEVRNFVIVKQVIKGQIQNPSPYSTGDVVTTDSLNHLSDNGKLYVLGENHESLVVVGSKGKVLLISKSTPAYADMIQTY